jgi:hypothetical protein
MSRFIFIILSIQASHVQLQEKQRRKRERLAAAASVYDISSAAFYLQAVSNEDSSGAGGSENWRNDAMLQMLVHQDLSGARSSFLRANEAIAE